MKKIRQRVAERRRSKRALRDQKKRAAELRLRDAATRVNLSALALSGTFDPPEFVRRGYYRDHAFECRDCGKSETWTAAQQKWWYEVAKGDVRTLAVRCRACRARERRRRSEVREAHASGLARKRRAGS